jgi:hypothetical protein
MSKAAHKTRRRRRAVAAPRSGRVAEFLRLRIAAPDTRSPAEFLHDMRAEQAAGQLANPATAALLDRLEGAI